MPARLASPALSASGLDISDTLVNNGDHVLASSLPELHEFAIDPDPGDGTTKIADIDSARDSGSEDDAAFIAAQQNASHRRNAALKQGSGRKGGGFQSMGFNATLLKAITRKGFSVPTPIQRRTMPIVLEGRDVVGMARTGSGKTACFVLPMVEILRTHNVKVGARAIILSPSRELAIQTLKFVKEFGRGTNLRTILLVGGDNLEDQFSQMTNNPDIIIATPGRFMHLLVEMSLDLSSIRYVVFDEADRLFEAGFAPQLRSLLAALPPKRQTLLFSATLPRSVAEFAKAGLKDPELIRLDAENKISPDLQSAFLSLKVADKDGALVHLLTDVIKVPHKSEHQQDRIVNAKKRKRDDTPQKGQDAPNSGSTIVFAATKHRVEYLAQLLQRAGFSISYVYGSLDHTARRIQVDRFRGGVSHVLVVTDVAARGIDIPMLANVVNYDFPPQPKIFVHRVGRTARAGRKGWSYNLVQTSDLPYLLDLQLFLGRRLVKGRSISAQANFANDLIVGGVPQSELEKHCEWVLKILSEDEDLAALRDVADRGEKQYLRSRNAASHDSAKRARTLAQDDTLVQANLLYEDHLPVDTAARDSMLARLSSFRPAETIFEYKRRETTIIGQIMQKQRSTKPSKEHGSTIGDIPEKAISDKSTYQIDELEDPQPASKDEGDLNDDQGTVLITSRDHQDSVKRYDAWQDVDSFMTFQPRASNLAEEKGYGVQSGSYDVAKNAGFEAAARGVTMDLANDESKGFAEASRPRQRWDKRSKKYVNTVNDSDGSRGKKTIISETGQKIAASFRSGRFEAWKKSNRLDRIPRTGEKENAMKSVNGQKLGARFKHYAERAPKQPDKYRDDYHKKKKKLAESTGMNSSTTPATQSRRVKSELRDVSAVRKQRSLKQKRREKNARPARKMKR